MENNQVVPPMAQPPAWLAGFKLPGYTGESRGKGDGVIADNATELDPSAKAGQLVTPLPDAKTIGDWITAIIPDQAKNLVDYVTTAVNGEDSNRQVAEQIANGHAFDKHVVEQDEFGSSIATKDHFAKQIENVLNNPSATKQLSNGRSAYWDDSTGMVVIQNPNATDGGTAFKPKNGKAYFDNLR
ncbi:hypothetical protein [Paraburkholderia heleia]|uniref:hypothetical protein n=1 Tax=Paraburkholderia heleia TaxID=634127 RepID=UPI0012ECE4BC|nr:hypothetical protein [Paraburkholderia heleia]